MGEVEISTRAYVKMCLHAARYPHAAVNGLLLAQRHRATLAGSLECLCITDCVPLFHNNLSLTVMLEVALNQVDVWSSQSDLLLAGYYQANSGIDDKSPSLLAQKAAGRIVELNEDAVLIMLDNRKLTINSRVPSIIVLEHKDRQWVPKDKNLVMWSDWESSHHICKSLLEAKAYTQLVDFDAHLDDIRKDWTNQQLNTEIAQLVSVANGSA
ncbi:ER membrane protein complex subunit 9 isoform X1 [Hemicordylus capensis]|nr:ER membrane protein complex subunit 9 isoform X1 [Hemicordylus capensis]XP_053114829.1 ER membrane protein complex subunit 9 isoform X1 [Hemicordylus capensis]XP_053114830.1 ER membrane protein complex subunit 9 isoform X1 [Hemicordylus capensis]XP_053114831.1 ER membrane protein complex subunit 9 isoform X1 [Hemicordylus capensis]